MGAVLNMRPDLFNAAIMGVPFVDVVTTMMDESIPLTNIEWEEWGNPTVSHAWPGSLPASLLDPGRGCMTACLSASCFQYPGRLRVQLHELLLVLLNL